MLKLSLLVMQLSLLGTIVGQSIPQSQLNRPYRYDELHQTIHVGRGLTYVGTSTSIQSFRNGIQLKPEINVFADFPGLKEIVVEDISLGATESTVVAAVLNFGEKSIRHVVLTYDGSSKLTSIWDTDPYYPLAIAVDGDGHVYLLGNRLDDDFTGKRSPYDLLFEYDSNGRILRSGLPSSTFVHGGRAIEPNVEITPPKLLMRSDKVYVYAPWENGFVVCSKDLKIVAQTNIGSVLRKISDAKKFKRLGVRDVQVVDQSHLLVRLAGHDKSTRNETVLAIILDTNNQTYEYFTVDQQAGNPIGIDGDQLLSLDPNGNIIQRKVQHLVKARP